MNQNSCRFCKISIAHPDDKLCVDCSIKKSYSLRCNSCGKSPCLVTREGILLDYCVDHVDECLTFLSRKRIYLGRSLKWNQTENDELKDRNSRLKDRAEKDYRDIEKLKDDLDRVKSQLKRERSERSNENQQKMKRHREEQDKDEIIRKLTEDNGRLKSTVDLLTSLLVSK